MVRAYFWVNPTLIVMRYLIPITLSVALIAVSCGGSGEKKIISVEKKTVLKEPVHVTPNRELSLHVAGMTCEQGCGGTIRMALKETGAVDRCSFDFKENRDVNTAFITFDKDKITADKIVAIIEKLNDHQFTTSNASTRPLEAMTESSETTPSITVTETEKSVKEIGVSATSFELPNLFELFSRMIR